MGLKNPLFGGTKRGFLGGRKPPFLGVEKGVFCLGVGIDRVERVDCVELLEVFLFPFLIFSRVEHKEHKDFGWGKDRMD